MFGLHFLSIVTKIKFKEIIVNDSIIILKIKNFKIFILLYKKNDVIFINIIVIHKFFE